MWACTPYCHPARYELDPHDELDEPEELNELEELLQELDEHELDELLQGLLEPLQSGDGLNPPLPGT